MKSSVLIYERAVRKSEQGVKDAEARYNETKATKDLYALNYARYIERQNKRDYAELLRSIE